MNLERNRNSYLKQKKRADKDRLGDENNRQSEEIQATETHRTEQGIWLRKKKIILRRKKQMKTYDDRKHWYHRQRAQVSDK